MKTFWNYLLTSVVSGAVTAFASCVSMAGPIHWGHCGTMAGVGAAVGAVNLFRTSPTTTQAP